ncbi:MAG: hypothetical protein D6762_07995 [Candidatus Neomarinimicrobiota bacterium]|nr:MAG: hypothetical protein D6762_07995 [Candidatus Neomarinimicrobiota bacterium]
MIDRNRTLWMLLVGLTLVLIIVSAGKSYPVIKNWKKVKHRAAQVQFGTDEQLEAEIEYLENRLQRRSEYRFQLENEPMRLTNVLYLTDQYGRRRGRNRGKIRVTAVILGTTENQAIINYKEKHFTVTVGDSVDKYVVAWIDTDEVVLTNDQKEYHYPVVTSPLEETAEQSGKKQRSE